MTSDDIISKIIELESEQTKLRIEYQELKDNTKHLEDKKSELHIAYEEIRDLYQEATKKWDLVKADLNICNQKGLTNKEELDRLKREYSRLQDAELIHQEYLDKVNEFRESCLNSYWRKENRSDGLGAFTHQIEGAIHLAVTKQALLGDKRGIGKSLTSLIWLDLIEAKKVIVISPSDTMNNFIREVKLWTPHRMCVKLGKLDRGVRDVLLEQLKHVSEFLVVINYEAWRKDKQLISDLIALKADTLICDEAHRAKNLNTTTCQGVMALRFGTNLCPSCRSEDYYSIRTFDRNPNKAVCDGCHYTGFITDFCTIQYVLPMTGTPILNRPQELFPHLRLINPKDFTTENLYLRDFCAKNAQGRWVWQWGAEKEVMKKIGPRFLARDRKSAEVIIPPPTPVDHIITMDELAESYPKQEKAYFQARDYAQIVLDPDRKIAMSMPVFLTVILRLRQVLTWPAAIELKWNNPDTQMEEVLAKLDVHESAKVDKAEELIKEINEEGERVVLFSQFKAPLHELQRRLGSSAAIYDGTTSSYQRNNIQLDFDPKTCPQIPRWQSVLCNYKAAGEGLNLNAATHMIILDKEWNPGRQDQAYGRIDRIGQTRETMIHTIKVEPSIDTWMEALIEEKANLIGGFEVQANAFQKAYDALRNGEI